VFVETGDLLHKPTPDDLRKYILGPAAPPIAARPTAGLTAASDIEVRLEKHGGDQRKAPRPDLHPTMTSSSDLGA